LGLRYSPLTISWGLAAKKIGAFVVNIGILTVNVGYIEVARDDAVKAVNGINGKIQADQGGLWW
jgi:hypothetical protein